ncbi:hypothetical protein [Desulfoferrobacter suflitae]|uniref:hypothetical protein n=1 Tax=Desulfoferrobacter suflitae TaxID=2865782 RepID=UPI002164C090|nr:hypothetical protein [Desulfoferrobacter suflitae]MCK8602316.1 hypothetical protein [Desulfoferrobacter suflitae]
MNMNVNIDELRKQRRPLWMTNYGQESYADMLGGGGDVYFDRLYPEWMRDYGSEYSDEDEA